MQISNYFLRSISQAATKGTDRANLHWAAEANECSIADGIPSAVPIKHCTLLGPMSSNPKWQWQVGQLLPFGWRWNLPSRSNPVGRVAFPKDLIRQARAFGPSGAFPQDICHCSVVCNPRGLARFIQLDHSGRRVDIDWSCPIQGSEPIAPSVPVP